MKYKLVYDCFNLETKIGGFGVTVLDEKNKKIASEAGGDNKFGTANRLKLYGILIGLRLLPDGSEVTLISDDEYSIKSTLNLCKRNANLDILEKIDYEKKRLRNIDHIWLKDCKTKEQEVAKYCQNLAIEIVEKKKYSNIIDYFPNKCALPDEDANKVAELEKKLEINKILDNIQLELNEIRKMI